MTLAFVSQAVALDLAQDLTGGDITAELVAADKQAQAQIITREQAIFCGQPWADEVLRQVDPSIVIEWQVADGDGVAPNQTLATLTGLAQSLLSAERALLNWLQTLSGTATTVAHYVSYLAESETKLLDTRKTLPCLREAQKYAVHCGGGVNHRMGLYDAFLIKENHISSCGSIQAAIEQARANHPEKTLEIEVETLAELEQAIVAKPDIIMLDNFSDDMLKQALVLDRATIQFEVSGNVDGDRLRQLAGLGVDFISMGALTKHVRSIDLSMRLR